MVVSIFNIGTPDRKIISSFSRTKKELPARTVLLDCDLLPRSESSLGLLCQSCEALRIRDSDIGKDLTVELDAGLLQSVHESGVRHTVQTASSVDTCDPELSEIPLLVSSVSVCVIAGLKDLLVSNLEKLALLAEITLSLL